MAPKSSQDNDAFGSEDKKEKRKESIKLLQRLFPNRFKLMKGGWKNSPVIVMSSQRDAPNVSHEGICLLNDVSL